MSKDEWILEVSTSPRKMPRIVVMGEPGVGKTTWGCSAPNAVLVATEDGASGIPIMRLPKDRLSSSWDDILKAVKTLLEAEHDREWLVLDTINGAADLCAQHVCDRDFGGQWESSKGVEGFNACGRGDNATAQEFRRLLKGLDLLRERKNMGCILLSHLGLQRSGNALGEDFQKFTGDMTKQTWALTLAWADNVGHATRDFVVTVPQGKEDSGKAKARARNDDRWLVFDGGPGLDAKARRGYEVPGRLPLVWDAYAKAVGLGGMK